MTGQAIRNGDVVTFRIIIANVGNYPAYDVYVDDTISPNLDYQSGTARLNGGGVAVTRNGQNLIFNTSRNLGDKGGSADDPPDTTNWLLTFDAKIVSNSPQTVDFFDNSARVYYAKTNGGVQNLSVPVSTGLVPLRTGKALVPNIKEIAP